MNCLEFRRRLGGDPASTEAAFVAHRASCANCAAASARALEFEARLRRAILVPAPGGLADRVLLAQTTQSRQEQRQKRRGVVALFAAAASVVVAFTYVHRAEQSAMPLGDLVVEHVLHHESHAIESRKRVDPGAISAAFADRGVALARSPLGVSYLHECPVGPYRTVHMVMPVGDRAVSVVYVADPPASLRGDFESGGMRGREVALGSGALVMVAADGEDFDAIELEWKGAVAARVAEVPMYARGGQSTLVSAPTRGRRLAAP